eukprot:TRINITY_DN845_c0_g1_i1.p1 TRINITY_DN845_c0_g1~~TRINITY_DN845_c0_g1_i1.p1  ORF type:complete len:661 (+),score=112.47 TRINITY_DN845_c0_g1_i1:454-2436(+)
MATYNSNSSNQRDIMSTLYFRNPVHASYAESSLPGNMVYMDYLSTGPFSDNIANQTLPVPNVVLSQESPVGPSEVAPRFGEHNNNVWRDGKNEMFMKQIGFEQINDHTGLRSQMGILNGERSFDSNVFAVRGQGLSLSLSTQIPSAFSFQYRQSNNEISLLASHQSTSGDNGSCRDDGSTNKHSRNAEFPPAYTGGDFESLANIVPNSKYLKVAQQLLDEVVNRHKALKLESDKSLRFHAPVCITGCKETEGGLKAVALPPPMGGIDSNSQESTATSTSDLSLAEREDIQNKMTKLLAMLDEIDRRYKHYYHQMQIVVSSFDVIAGFGAAKSYTALASQTISQHFRCLRDAISGHIRASQKILGDQCTIYGKGGGLSRLRLVDQQLRQQRALQQLGMIQQHAWRPQRGLPESSVSILRAWLFEHFLHPYPKDSDKIMLARQTGLTRSQVSNWFINARVRLWKPMVEEMYKEEIGDAEMDSNSSSENPTKAMDEIGPSEDREESQSMKSASEVCHMSQYTDSKSDIASDVEMSGTTAGTNYAKLKLRDQRPNADDCRFLQDALVHSDGSGRFITYQMAELGRFESNGGGGGVSLTLGLQHCDGGGLPVSGAEQNFVPVRGGDDDMYNSTSVGADTTVYECMDLGNQRHRFGSSHLLHDFVA